MHMTVRNVTLIIIPKYYYNLLHLCIEVHLNRVTFTHLLDLILILIISMVIIIVIILLFFYLQCLLVVLV